MSKATKKAAVERQKARERKQKIFIGVVSVVLAGVLILAIALSSKKDKDKNNLAESSVSGAETLASITHYADIEIENYGTVTLALDGVTAPETVANFVKLAQEGFYDGLTFHRIIEGFMMQGGDPDGNGTGGSDTYVTGEFSQNGFDNPISHTRGAISMARSNEYDSARSQFFIVHQDSTYLDGAYAAFGYVTEGIEVVDAVCTDAQPIDGNGTIPADAQPVIHSITITEA